MKSDQRSDRRTKPSIADDVGEGSFPRLMVVVTDQEVMHYHTLQCSFWACPKRYGDPSVRSLGSHCCSFGEQLLLFLYSFLAVGVCGRPAMASPLVLIKGAAIVGMAAIWLPSAVLSWGETLMSGWQSLAGGPLATSLLSWCVALRPFHLLTVSGGIHRR